MISNANLTREEGVEQADYQEGQQHGTARSSVQRALTEGSLVCTGGRGFLACTDGGSLVCTGGRGFLACTDGGGLVCTLEHRAPAGARLQCTATAERIVHCRTEQSKILTNETERIYLFH